MVEGVGPVVGGGEVALAGGEVEPTAGAEVAWVAAAAMARTPKAEPWIMARLRAASMLGSWIAIREGSWQEVAVWEVWVAD